jgi:hypothetical protein
MPRLLTQITRIRPNNKGAKIEPLKTEIQATLKLIPKIIPRPKPQLKRKNHQRTETLNQKVMRTNRRYQNF